MQLLILERVPTDAAFHVPQRYRTVFARTEQTQQTEQTEQPVSAHSERCRSARPRLLANLRSQLPEWLLATAHWPLLSSLIDWADGLFEYVNGDSHTDSTSSSSRSTSVHPTESGETCRSGKPANGQRSLPTQNC